MTTGRPREFDVDEAVAKAMRLFWQKGYEGTSLSDLTSELGITRPSLYAAFGNKEALFLAALDKYDLETSRFIQAALDAPNPQALAEVLLYGACAFHADASNPRGCLMVHGALVGGDVGLSVRKETGRRRALLTKRIGRRLRQAKVEGHLQKTANTSALARYLVAVLRGIAVEAASGAGPVVLRRIADVAIRAWLVGEKEV